MFEHLLVSSVGPGGIPLVWSAPFVLLLITIALMPLIRQHWWEKHYAKVALAFGAIPLIYYFGVARAPGAWLVAMEEYVSFIILLASLFLISGGINIRVSRQATPLANTALLLIGAIVANIFGTTVASMLLIRPYLRMNRGHIRAYHVVFFIFIVANCGGLLTPIGDPPLFLGYLNGVPFRWTVDHLWPIWTFCVGILLMLFFIIDTLEHRRTPRHDGSDPGPQVHILGIHNFIFISAVLFAVFRPGVFETIAEISKQGFTLGGAADLVFSRELLMLGAMLLSRASTSQAVYEHNQFSYAPIREVAVLFVAIFSTMAPALGWLGENASKMQLTTPGQFYFTSGTLSSVLDNAPTYLTFAQIRRAEVNDADVQHATALLEEMTKTKRLATPENLPDGDVRSAVEAMVVSHADRIEAGTLNEPLVRVGFLVGVPRLMEFLIAISAGSVLFGACTYIGNGPNFMVKSIADAAGVKTPSFLGYVFVYSLPILIPLYTMVWLIFIG